MKKPVFVLFVDLTAAFDHVNRQWLFQTIKSRYNDQRLEPMISLLEALYSHTTTAAEEGHLAAPHAIQVTAHSVGRWSASFTAHKPTKNPQQWTDPWDLPSHSPIWNAELHTLWLQSLAAASVRKQPEVAALSSTRTRQECVFGNRRD